MCLIHCFYFLSFSKTGSEEDKFRKVRRSQRVREQKEESGSSIEMMELPAGGGARAKEGM